MRRRVGADEIVCEESQAAVAEVVAAALPGLRGEAGQMVGLSAPPLRVVVTSRPPAVWQYYRPTLSLVGWFVGISAAVVLGAMLVSWVIGPGYPWVLAAVGVALMVAGPRIRYGLLLLLTGLMLLGAAWPLVFAVTAPLAAAGGAAGVAARSVRRTWRSMGGFAFSWGHLLRPVVVLHWPPPPRTAAVESLCFPPAPAEDRVRNPLAHEYTHVLLHARHASSPPAWLDEGLAFWLSEQLTGVVTWRPESRECIAEPEPARDPRERFTGQDWYYRLMARYYWEVRALAEAGRLPEVLAAPAGEVERLRPSLTAGTERPA